jgi:hypothetical protein
MLSKAQKDRYIKLYNTDGKISTTVMKILNANVNYNYAGWEEKLLKKVLPNFEKLDQIHNYITTKMPEFYKECCYNESSRIDEIKNIIKESEINPLNNKNWNKQIFSILNAMNEDITDEISACLYIAENMPEFFGLHTEYITEEDINDARVIFVENLSDDFTKNVKKESIEYCISKIIDYPVEYVGDWLRENIKDFYSRAFLSQLKMAKTLNISSIEKITDESITEEVQKENDILNDTFEEEDEPKELSIEEIILDSGVDFSKSGWEIELSRIIGNFTPEQAKQYMKDNMHDYYYENCYDEELILERLKDKILNSKIDFSKRNWFIEVSRIMDNSPSEAYHFVKDNMQDLFNKCYSNEKYGEDGVLTVPNYVVMAINTGVDFVKDNNVEEKLSQAFNCSIEQAQKFVDNVLRKSFDFDEVVEEPIVEKTTSIEVKPLSAKAEQRKNLILNSKIDFNKKGWTKKIALLLNLSQNSVSNWVRVAMPDFYYNSCFKDILPQNKSYEVPRRIKVIKESGINFTKPWVTKVAKLFNVSENEARSFIKEYMPECYSTFRKY